MATRKRPGSAKRTVARQEAARKRGARGKRFVGETAEQSAEARRNERKKVTRMARAARKAKPAEAARTAGRSRRSRRSSGGAPARAAARARKAAESEAAFRAAEEDAALHGAEVEPAERPVSDDPAAETLERSTLHLLPGAAERAAASRSAAEPSRPPSVDVSSERSDAAIGEASPPPLGWALTDLARSAFGLARTIASVPFRIAFAIPRLAIRAIASV